MKYINKLKPFRGFIAGVALSTIVLLFIQAKTTSTENLFEVSKNLDIYNNMFKELNSYYVDPIEPGRLMKEGVDAMLENLDPYTNYITESDVEEYQFMTTGKYGGIGANMLHRGNDIYVGDVFENSPAQKAGLHPGDLVLQIDNEPAAGKSVDDLGLLLKGSPGTKLTIRVKDPFTKVESQKIITRGEIEISSVPYSALTGDDKNVAYVKLTQFTQGCSRQVHDAFDSLYKANPNLKGLILDLRSNPGGLLEEAVSICNLFIDKGQNVVITKGKTPDIEKRYTTQNNPWNTQLPLTVLVNHSSASSSEIVAGTLQDLDRAVIIGERSYGKGLVQVTRPLGYNSHLKLTIARYYTPSGRCIQALDYSHRNADKSVSKFADSLKRQFKTKNGRAVFSAGGVEPDVKLQEPAISAIEANIITKNYLFDYATDYVRKHPTIADAALFSLTDGEMNDFIKWMANKDYAYKSNLEIELDSLKNMAIKENKYSEAKKEFDALRQKLAHDKKEELLKYKEHIRQSLENEIVSRYFYNKGRAVNGLRYDAYFDKAVYLLTHNAEYSRLLK